MVQSLCWHRSCTHSPYSRVDLPVPLETSLHATGCTGPKLRNAVSSHLVLKEQAQLGVVLTISVLSWHVINLLQPSCFFRSSPLLGKFLRRLEAFPVCCKYPILMV